ncbi:unnamed protein product [Lampetra planeri]
MTALVEREIQQQQWPECLLAPIPLVTGGWEWLEGWINCLTGAVSQLVTKLTGRPGVAELVAETMELVFQNCPAVSGQN